MNPPDSSDDVGRIVADRYHLRGRIGSGLAAAVYFAEDLQEDRDVAVKIFDRSLIDNAAFLERFYASAEQAATLEHPNIAAVYDWGADLAPYLVTELCDGGSLQTLLDRGDLLTPSQALVVALEAARALEYAHSMGFEHRDIRPSNLLFTGDQRLRFSDFGFARVSADMPATSPDHALRTVRYASPEQARGRPVTDRSDLYSLALTIGQAVTGQPPSVAETVVGTMMSRAEAAIEFGPEMGELRGPLERCGRIDPTERPEAGELVIALLAAAEAMPRPSALPLAGLIIDESTATPEDQVETIIDAAAEVDVSEVDLAGEADQVAADTDVYAADIDPAELNPTEFDPAEFDPADPEFEDDLDLTFDASFDDGAEFDPVDHDEPAAIEFNLDDIPADSADLAVDDEIAAALDETEALAAVGQRADLALVPDADPVFSEITPLPVELPEIPDVPDIPEAPDVPEIAPAAELDVPEARSAVLVARDKDRAYEQEDDDLEDRLPWWPLAVLFLIVGAAAALGVFAYLRLDAGRTHQVPNVVGLAFEDLDAEIGDFGWNVERLEGRLDGSTEGTIIVQDPDVGAQLDEGDTLRVTVSLGSAMVEIPSDLGGLTVEQAEGRLKSVGLELGGATQENSEALAAGLVIGIDEPTRQKPRGQSVAIRVSLGPVVRTVPDTLIGLSVDEAINLLAGLRLIAVEEPVFDPAAAEGTVLGSTPAPGETVAADTLVTLLVSAGPEPVEIPDVTGLTLQEAIDVVEALGLIFIAPEGTPGEPVIGTDPPIGEIVDVGAEIIIILDDPPEDGEDPDDG